MTKLTKFFSALIFSVFTLTVSVAPAFAANAGNFNTGFQSTNTAIVNHTTTITTNTASNAFVSNETNTFVNTGGNQSNGNTVGGSVVSGGASINVSNFNSVNKTFVFIK
jgi:hypothetical protein